jgi:hypothetical protein
LLVIAILNVEAMNKVISAVIGFVLLFFVVDVSYGLQFMRYYLLLLIAVVYFIVYDSD